jgi:hypothetical protein
MGANDRLWERAITASGRKKTRAIRDRTEIPAEKGVPNAPKIRAANDIR